MELLNIILLVEPIKQTNDILSIMITALSTLILALGSNWIKSYFDSKVRDIKLKEQEDTQDKKLESQIKLVIGEIKGLSNIVVTLERKLDIHLDETDFISTLTDSIQNKSAKILSLSFSLHQKYKNMLSHWADIIGDFSKNYNDNKNRRKDKSNLEKLLTQDMEIYLNDFNNYIDSFDTEYRMLNNKKYRFSQFLEDAKIHNRTHLLVARLAENGFEGDKNKMVDIFIKYISDYFESFLTAIAVWEKLPLYEFNEKVA